MASQPQPIARVVHQAAEGARNTIAARNRAILAMRADGASLRAIAEAADLSVEGVRRILARGGAS